MNKTFSRENKVKNTWRNLEWKYTKEQRYQSMPMITARPNIGHKSSFWINDLLGSKYYYDIIVKTRIPIIIIIIIANIFCAHRHSLKHENCTLP